MRGLFRPAPSAPAILCAPLLVRPVRNVRPASLIRHHADAHARTRARAAHARIPVDASGRGGPRHCDKRPRSPRSSCSPPPCCNMLCCVASRRSRRARATTLSRRAPGSLPPPLRSAARHLTCGPRTRVRCVHARVRHRWRRVPEIDQHGSDPLRIAACIRRVRPVRSIAAHAPRFCGRARWTHRRLQGSRAAAKQRRAGDAEGAHAAAGAAGGCARMLMRSAFAAASRPRRIRCYRCRRSASSCGSRRGSRRISCRRTGKRSVSPPRTACPRDPAVRRACPRVNARRRQCVDCAARGSALRHAVMCATAQRSTAKRRLALGAPTGGLRPLRSLVVG